MQEYQRKKSVSVPVLIVLAAGRGQTAVGQLEVM